MPIALRRDYDALTLRLMARKAKSPVQARRLLALAMIYDGSTRAEAASVFGVTPQVIRDWAVAFNEAGPDGLLNRKAPGKKKALTDEQRTKLAEFVQSFADRQQTLRLSDITSWLQTDSNAQVGSQTVSRELRALGFRKQVLEPKKKEDARNQTGPAVKRVWQRSKAERH